MDFRAIVRQFNASVAYAQAIIRGIHGRHASAWLADEAGISKRTARRWLSSAAPRGRRDAIIAAAVTATSSPNGIAAAILRGMATNGGTITVGNVDVAYDDEDEGVRSIQQIDIDAWVADDLMSAADALDAGDLQAAADAFSDAIISGYEHGLEDTLTITDYRDGISYNG